MFIYIEGVRLQNLPLWMIFSNENVNKPACRNNNFVPKISLLAFFEYFWGNRMSKHIEI